MSTATAPAARRRLIVAEDSIPTLARGTRLRYDETRQRWVLLVPERVMAPDEIAVEILQLCDGQRSVAAIIDQLAAAYAAPREEIGADVIAMLQDLAGSGFVVEARRATP
ncbi:pyrroloquinoline quinone biosynthesis protein PqqD [Devosia sp. Root413D1]|uniref:pyrroloquinoline quinone biosynthesis peptide chaperone PqqD n=1 Tax=unclassified Devosia TaxID=196773 RepID=UPI0006F6CD1F|nr:MULTISPECIES: pyrroloquinoline quinone biosynthesis peptide chaperone PqqD [unclassified Devosia]KQU95648.1 pyrroloquinoline quinone biosynthesis protein PqqD [Devosia sp. Root105]KQW78025.1 pyrroloquinoline quinone biosynthesis protein PqqD [Devosia sp. Root413D1]